MQNFTFFLAFMLSYSVHQVGSKLWIKYKNEFPILMYYTTEFIPWEYII